MNASPIDNGPSLSIVTITYRDAEGLDQTLCSLAPCRSLPFSIELIVVDSSPEENADILAQHKADWQASGSTLVQIVQVPPAGIYAAMNAGMAAATGKFVWFLHCRDRLASTDALREGLRAADEEQADQVWLAAAFERDGAFLYNRLPGRRWEDNVIGKNRLCQQAMLYRRDSLLDVGPFSTEFKLASDYLHHLECYLAGQKAIRLDNVLALYDMSGALAQWKKTMREYWAVSELVKQRLSVALRRRHYAGLVREVVRIAALKTVVALPFGTKLRPLWHQWKRIRC